MDMRKDLFESFSVTELLNMAIYRICEVMLVQTMKYSVYDSVILGNVIYL
jgi:hypothetical protein